MQVIHLTDPTNPTTSVANSKKVLAIGDFDGVHAGHREVIRRAQDTAARLGVSAALMTFHPHPREVLGKVEYRSVLTPLPDKLEIFRSLGVDCVYIVAFSESFSRLTPERFVSDVLLPLGIESVIVGFDFRFGHQGEGTADTLAEYAHGQFAVEIVRPFRQEGDKVSSTVIRDCLSKGEVERAGRLLERPYSISGKVVSGRALGKTIGFPTANLELPERYFIPSHGVYAVKAQVRGLDYNGVMNIGVKPTFGGEPQVSVEAHLFDFDESIYGETVTVEFISYLRSEKKFSSVDELVAQIRRDADKAREILTTVGPQSGSILLP